MTVVAHSSRLFFRHSSVSDARSNFAAKSAGTD